MWLVQFACRIPFIDTHSKLLILRRLVLLHATIVSGCWKVRGPDRGCHHLGNLLVSNLCLERLYHLLLLVDDRGLPLNLRECLLLVLESKFLHSIDLVLQGCDPIEHGVFDQREVGLQGGILC